MLLFKEVGVIESYLTESMFPGSPFPKFPSFPQKLKVFLMKTGKGFLSQVKLIKSNGDNAMIQS